jgi:hypothetical protein
MAVAAGSGRGGPELTSHRLAWAGGVGLPRVAGAEQSHLHQRHLQALHHPPQIRARAHRGRQRRGASPRAFHTDSLHHHTHYHHTHIHSHTHTLTHGHCVGAPGDRAGPLAPRGRPPCGCCQGGKPPPAALPLPHSPRLAPYHCAPARATGRAAAGAGGCQTGQPPCGAQC